MKEFLVGAIGSALDLGIGTADDVLAHVTPDVLAEHLPRPLWARLITACLGAPKVNAQLVVDTIGITNLCEHVPEATMWSIVSDIALRAMGKSGAVVTPMPVATKSQPVAGSDSRPTAAAAPGDSRPTALPQPPSAPSPADRAANRQPFRSQVGAGAASRSAALSPGSTARRPQAAAAPAPQPPPMPGAMPASQLVGSRVTPPSPRRGTTSTDFEIDTDIGNADSWKGKEIDVEEDLIEWAGSDETITGDGAGGGNAGGGKPRR